MYILLSQRAVAVAARHRARRHSCTSPTTKRNSKRRLFYRSAPPETRPPREPEAGRTKRRRRERSRRSRELESCSRVRTRMRSNPTSRSVRIHIITLSACSQCFFCWCPSSLQIRWTQNRKRRTLTRTTRVTAARRRDRRRSAYVNLSCLRLRESRAVARVALRTPLVTVTRRTERRRCDEAAGSNRVALDSAVYRMCSISGSIILYINKPGGWLQALFCFIASYSRYYEYYKWKKICSVKSTVSLRKVRWQ